MDDRLPGVVAENLSEGELPKGDAPIDQDWMLQLAVENGWRVRTYSYRPPPPNSPRGRLDALTSYDADALRWVTWTLERDTEWGVATLFLCEKGAGRPRYRHPLDLSAFPCHPKDDQTIRRLIKQVPRNP